MSQVENQSDDNDFSVLDQKTVSTPVMEGAEENAANQIEDEDQTRSNEVEPPQTEAIATEQQLVSIEEVDEEEEQPQEKQKESRSAWKWNLLNSALSLSALGACGYILLAGQPVSNAGDNKMLAANVSALTNSHSDLQNQLADLETELNSKATAQDHLVLTQSVTTLEDSINARLNGINDKLSGMVSTSNLQTAISNNLPETVSLSDFDRLEKRSSSGINKLTSQVQELTNKVDGVTAQVSNQNAKKFKSNTLSSAQVIELLNGNELFSTDLLDGKPYAVFANAKDGAYIVREKDTVGGLVITKIRNDSVEFRTDKYEVGFLNTQARVK